MTKANKILIESSKKGYKVDKEGYVIGLKGNKLSLNVISNIGYHYFSFRLDKLRVIVNTHRLQAFQKYGDKIFEEGIVVRHLDGNPLNNSWENIAIGTHSDNMMDIPALKRRIKSSHPKHDHSEIIKDREDGMTYSEIMEKYNITSRGTVSFIINKSLIREDNG